MLPHLWDMQRAMSIQTAGGSVQLDGSQQLLSHQNCGCGPMAGRPVPGTEAWEPPTFGEERHTALEVRQLGGRGSKHSAESQKGDSGQ